MKLQELPKPGMRNIKTAIAVVLCIIILRFFSDNSPFYACIAAVIAMQSTVQSSWKTGVTRIIGTLAGASVGVLLSLIGVNNVLITGVGIVVVIYITNILKQNAAIGIACIVYLAIMVNVKDTTPLNYALMRTAETFFGIIMAMVVNSVVFPPVKEKE